MQGRQGQGVYKLRSIPRLDVVRKQISELYRVEHFTYHAEQLACDSSLTANAQLGTHLLGERGRQKGHSECG
ncbi:hypothetical protein HanHA300_Chr03g0081181 [Helianthus annuus]|nr:hypothetical protein HanHA300_Chr03g0081181 [Helianthus annuus]KAJ0607101.1 hypothetical protein HanHA89_Chr03g0092621 [Helianthus annuus]KAJ0767154.1 hypothetical protein HanLR1_Chr03g0085841 [Helianthus annuus]